MKEVIKTVKFENVAIGQHFVANGTRWIKRSNRTASVVNAAVVTASVVNAAGPVFYFGKSELVRIAAAAN